MRPWNRTAEQVIAGIADSTQGVVTHTQLLEAGISRGQIKRRVLKGYLIAEYPGVYRVGHCAPSVEASSLAAVLACGIGALLSGRAAGYLLGLLKGPAPQPEVTVPRQRRVRGVTTRRARGRFPVEGMV